MAANLRSDIEQGKSASESKMRRSEYSLVKDAAESSFGRSFSIIAHDDAVNAVIVGPDGFLFTGSDDCMVKIWRKNLGPSLHMLLTTLRGESGPGRDNGMGPVKALSLNANGSALYAGTSNGQIVCWEKERYSSSQMRQIDILCGPQHAILSLATGGN